MGGWAGMRQIGRAVQISSVLLLAAAFSLGCGSSLPENMGRVSGQVTLDGAPLADALVTFAPTDPSGSTMLAKTDSNGNYRGETHVGQHAVSIVTYRAGNPDSDPPREPVPEKVPVNYNVKSELKVEVKPGDNTHDFPLKPGPVVQPRPDPE
jgi:hypothetical protein